MDAATVMNVARTLFKALNSDEVRNLCSIFKYESELEKLLSTVKTIEKTLLDADSKCQELTESGQGWVENLKNALYEADDLLDEYRTIVQQLTTGMMPGGKLFRQVRRFLSSNNQFLFAYKTSTEVKKLREELDKIAKDHKDFGFSELYKPVKGRVETISYVEHEIIGRNDAKKEIVDLLLKDDSDKIISFVTIVGIGGLGKTALAQLVFSDSRIREAFQGNMYWICVSVKFDTKDILGEMISERKLGFEDLQREVRNRIGGKKFLVVLDDVWSENAREWDDLRDFLNLGGKGSRILVTSRSQKVAKAIGNYPIHKLQGLSEKDSWELFRKISLGEKEDEAIAGFVEIGKEIVKNCVNVPLSIRVVASLLRGQDINAWQSYRRIDLAKMRDDEDNYLMQTLMFSYYHLDPALKSCFSFCSVFPQDYEFYKKELIRLWSAHGYLVPSDTDKSMEDVGERYFSILLNRCFFQDVAWSSSDGVSVKMHDLIHDLARKIAGNETLTLSTSSTCEFEGKARHVFIDDSEERLANWSSVSNYTSKTLRTLFLEFSHSVSDVGRSDRILHTIISKCSRLRVLSIRYSDAKPLSDTLGRLLHLRHLELSHNNLEMLPKSISQLHNLETLKIDCLVLKELPKDTSKLVKLRVLDIKGCDRLTHMPAGMSKLTCLHTLTTFVVCEDDDRKKDKKGKLIDMKALINNLRGDLEIRNMNSRIGYFDKCMTVELDSLKIKYDLNCYQKGQKKLLEIIFSNSQSGKLFIQYYNGTKLPSWASGLVSIRLSDCKELLHLPSSLSQLCHLKYLSLLNMESMEYIEESDAQSPSATFFPSLEKLSLTKMSKLKGWWRDIRWMEYETVFIPSFPRLCKLYIQDCKRLTYNPQCPHAKELHLSKVNEALTFCMKGGGDEINPIYLNWLEIDDSGILNYLCREFVRSAVTIHLFDIEYSTPLLFNTSKLGIAREWRIWE